MSTATLAFEILLVRAFAIEYLHHFAFLAISVAMLGTGASGVMTTMLPGLNANLARRWFEPVCAATVLSLLLAPAIVDRIALDPTQFLWDRGQWVRIGAVYAVLAIPFGLGALVVLLALIVQPERSGVVYGTSFLGAGAGGVVALASTTAFLPARALAVPAVVGGLWWAAGQVRWTRWRIGAAAVGALSLVALARPFWRVEVSPQRALPALEAFPEAERIASRPGPAGWVTAVTSPAFRYAPGLSLGFRGDVPNHIALLLDGDLVGAVPATRDSSFDPTFYDWLPGALPYAIAERSRVLVLGLGSLPAMHVARAHGADQVTGVEPIGAIVALARELSGTDDVATALTAGDVRSVVAGVDEAFDLVVLPPTGGPGAGAGGVFALDEDYLHTVEAYQTYLRVTAPGGALAITSWLALPPRQSVRIILTAAAALRRVGGDPAAGLLVLRSWGTVTVLASRTGFSAAEIDRARTWARARQFDVDWYPGVGEPNIMFHELDDPTPYRAARAAAESESAAAAFADAYGFRVAPVTDATPYPRHFLRLGGIRRIWRSGAGTALPVAELGMIAALAALAQSVVLSIVLLVIPVAWPRRTGTGRKGSLLIYFSTIGVGYMAVEIATIRQLTLLLGRPAYAITAVLVTFLLSSGFGSVWSEAVDPSRARRLTGGLAVILAMYALLLLPIVHAILPASLPVRAVVGLIAITPPAFLMGSPFPVGLRRYAGDDPARRAWAWAGNGFASVVASPLAALIAVELGSVVLFLVGSLVYAAASLASWAPGRVPAARFRAHQIG